MNRTKLMPSSVSLLLLRFATVDVNGPQQCDEPQDHERMANLVLKTTRVHSCMYMHPVSMLNVIVNLAAGQVSLRTCNPCDCIRTLRCFLCNRKCR